MLNFIRKRKTRKFRVNINTIHRITLKNSNLRLYYKIEEWLYFGDCNPAIVVSTNPVVVAESLSGVWIKIVKE